MTHTRRVRRLVLTGLALIVLVLDPRVVALPSGATLSGTTGSPGNLFTAGSITLGPMPASALLTASGLKPGDAVSGSLTVSNGGTLSLRYAMVTATTNADGKGLAGQLQLVVREAGSSCEAFDGLEIYNGPLASGAFGSAVAGAHAGDRALNASTAEILCFRTSLPVSTPAAFELATTTATFAFTAEQTASNP